MRGLRKVLTPFAPDQSGAVSVLYELGGMTVVVDAGGCTGNICGFDEPRWYTAKSAVFSAGLRDIDAILGRDDLLLRKIEIAARDSAAGAAQRPFAFLALVGTPVPAVIGTDLPALAQLAEQKTGLPAIAIPANGMQLYDRGAESAWLELFRKFAQPAAPDAHRVGVIGCTPLDFGPVCRADVEAALAAAPGLCAGGAQPRHFAVYGLGAGAQEFAQAAAAERNVVVSPAGIAAAKELQRRFGTPYTLLDPFARRLLRPEMTAGAPRILIVHQSVTSLTLAQAIRQENPAAAVTRAGWFMAPPETGAVLALREEDDFAALVSRGFDIIVADAALRELVPGFAGLWVDACHFAVSGRREAFERTDT